jgi:hypothetical protein
MKDYSGLPGADWILRGVAELVRGELTSEALCVAGATGLLRELNIDLPPAVVVPRDPEILFYRSLAGKTDDPYGRYNAMRRELDSFAKALYSRLHLARRSIQQMEKR